ncbi:tripartite tricarboxylate transporter substrate binding protein [Variovorax sp. J31P179]|uniref:Bug family tripartite tricarboxylate transporter substrate binding protein n=1 Tax=Variovorax sp. J31P179 TaxID=3053508 RepID=UPI002577F45B|nr:tripartite tricarboxylate transporter substrate binding protein [Variovorax sp. J31P179]MDM0084602.1 tripartite tricarboxylate transporter substrate binding protein [Variovorax sp. J31P179]
MKRKTIAWLFGLASAACFVSASIAHAERFPSRPIKLVVPYSAGGLPDTVARVLSRALGDVLGQAVYVDNKPGAGGAVAASAIMQAPADGYTLLVTDGPMLSITPLLTKKVGYDASTDFVPISLVGRAPLFLAVNKDVKANSLDELIALAKAKPGALNYGSAGTGSIHHLTTEAMNASFGIVMTHVPFKGSANSVPALIAGQVDMVFASPPSLMGFVKAGQAKLLATNSSTRSPLAPQMPALAEKIPGFDFAFTVAVLAKNGTPNEAIVRISREIEKIVKKPEVVEQLHQAGVDPVGGSPEQLAQALRSEKERVTDAAARAQLKAE